KPHGIIIFGANGSGKTTLGRELARILNFKHMDIEDYAFVKSDIPYTNGRSKEECIDLMITDIKKHRLFVISAVTGDFGETIPQFYELAVYISAPKEIRMERIKRREIKRFGDRVLEGGDMYEQRQRFHDFVASRSLEGIEKWAETLMCPMLRIDGTKDYRKTATDIAALYLNQMEKVKL
ncbi:MAG: AAA family ATPase, partial [Eubacteriales bacterium]|nr:AAA family ATPase [Eubacteriales bacterium]